MSDLEDDLRKFFGLPPHDEVPNFCRGDGYFMKSVEQKYGASIWVLAKRIPGIWKEIRSDVRWLYEEEQGDDLS